jgi:hypothetical protein
MRFVVDKAALGQVLSPSTSVFSRQFHSNGAPLQVKNEKKLIIFITGLRSKPQGCGASVASAMGPFIAKMVSNIKFYINLCSASRADKCGQTDGHGEAKSRLSQFCKRF